VPAGLNSVVAVGGGGAHSLALRSDGSVVAWGGGKNNFGFYPQYGQSMIPAGLTNAVAVAVGYAHSVALRADGTVLSWGYNGADQKNAPPGLSNVVFISAGWQTGLAISADQVPVAVDVTGPSPRVSFHTFSGQRYSVEFSADLSPNSWAALSGGATEGDGRDVSVSDTNATTGAARFYRVVRTQ
jgi:hypothetical protein